MRYPLFSFLLLLILSGCKTNQINQKTSKGREGLWIEEYALDSSKYKSVGKYHNGDPIKKWNYYLNDKIIKKEKYRQNICHTTYYYKDGTIQSKGKTKFVADKQDTHWFYFGDWKYYDQTGKLSEIKKYDEGKLVEERIID